MKNKKVVTIVLVAVLALAGCGSVAEAENTVPETEAVIETVAVVETERAESFETTESIEVYVPKTELETESTEVESAEDIVLESEEFTEIENEPSPKADTIGYTYTDMNTTMYAKSSVNVRSLPSTDGTKIGTLSTNQAVAVTGQCNETGWYRIQYANGEAYVSNKYLSSEMVAESTQTNGTEEILNAAIEAAIAQYGPNIIIFNDGTVYDLATWEHLGTIDSIRQIFFPDTAGNFDRAAAEEVWSYMNAERTAAGLNPIAWDENIYNFACQRAQAIVTNFSHEGCGSYGENIQMSTLYLDAQFLHGQWYSSPGHHANYMNASYTRGACAVYVCNGAVFAVENFSY